MLFLVLDSSTLSLVGHYDWVAAKELKLSYYNKDTHNMVTYVKFLSSSPDGCSDAISALNDFDGAQLKAYL